MKDKENDIFGIEAVERELNELKPLLDQVMKPSLPSDETLAKIHQAALMQVTRKRRFWRRIRLVSAVASVAVALAGIGHLSLKRSADSRPVEGGNKQLLQESALDSDAELLLSLQGLDSESYFIAEEEGFWQ